MSHLLKLLLSISISRVRSSRIGGIAEQMIEDRKHLKDRQWTPKAIYRTVEDEELNDSED